MSPIRQFFVDADIGGIEPSNSQIGERSLPKYEDPILDELLISYQKQTLTITDVDVIKRIENWRGGQSNNEVVVKLLGVDTDER